MVWPPVSLCMILFLLLYKMVWTFDSIESYLEVISCGTILMLYRVVLTFDTGQNPVVWPCKGNFFGSTWNIFILNLECWVHMWEWEGKLWAQGCCLPGRNWHMVFYWVWWVWGWDFVFVQLPKIQNIVTVHIFMWNRVLASQCEHYRRLEVNVYYINFSEWRGQFRKPNPVTIAESSKGRRCGGFQSIVIVQRSVLSCLDWYLWKGIAWWTLSRQVLRLFACTVQWP